MEKRNETIDIIKAIAIILVVVGHCIQYGSGHQYIINLAFFDNFLFKFIYSFHMPLFAIISGYLIFNSINKYKTKDLIINRLKSNILPIISFSIIEILYYVISKHNLTTTSIINIFIEKLWFLWAIFLFSIIVIIINKYLKDNPLIYILIFLITFLAPSIYNLHLYAFLYPYFVIGYLFNKHKFGSKKLFNNYLFIISIIVFGVLFYFYNYDSYIYTTKMSIINNYKQLFIDIYRFIIGLVGSYVIIALIEKIDNNKHKNKIKKSILYIGKSTLGIYALSNYLFILLRKVTYNLASINYLYLFLEVSSTILICLIAIFIIRKNKISSLLFLGR